MVFFYFIRYSLSPICLEFYAFSLLYWLVLCYFCILFLSSNFFEAKHFLYYDFFASINCFIWSSHILSIFFCFVPFVSLFFINVRILLIILCFGSFPVLPNICFVFVDTVLIKFYSFFALHLMLSSFESPILNISSCLTETFFI
jgi:hypothetical protein